MPARHGRRGAALRRREATKPSHLRSAPARGSGAYARPSTHLEPARGTPHERWRTVEPKAAAVPRRRARLVILRVGRISPSSLAHQPLQDVEGLRC